MWVGWRQSPNSASALTHKTHDDNSPKENNMIDGFVENEIIISYGGGGPGMENVLDL